MTSKKRSARTRCGKGPATSTLDRMEQPGAGMNAATGALMQFTAVFQEVSEGYGAASGGEVPYDRSSDRR